MYLSSSFIFHFFLLVKLFYFPLFRWFSFSHSIQWYGIDLMWCSEGVQCAAMMTTDDGCGAKLNNHQFLANWYVAALSARVAPRGPCLVTRRTRDTACDTWHNLLVKLAPRPPRGNLIMLLGRCTPPIFGPQIFSLPDTFGDSQEEEVLECGCTPVWMVWHHRNV